MWAHKDKTVSKNILKVEKLLKEVTLWIHPEGPVGGSLYLRPEDGHNTAELPVDILKQDDPFVVLKSNIGEDIRFYNPASIIRAIYPQSNKIVAE